jgi:hypothetical protein
METVTTTVRLPKELLDKLKERAAREYRSLNQQIVKYLEEGLDREH